MKDKTRKLRYIISPICLLLLPTCIGCAAIGGRIIHTGPFVGVKADYDMCFRRERIDPKSRVNPVIAIIDFPFSLIIDLILLPFEIGEESNCPMRPENE